VSIDNDWIIKVTDAALKPNKPVTKATADRMKDLLKGRISEQQLRAKELAEIAKELIIDMAIPAKPSDMENQ
jgi:hypothetical protein